MRKEKTRESVRKRRDELFKRGWKNKKQILPLVSRADDADFRLVVGWCIEFEEVMSKQRERLADPTPRM